MVGFSGLMLWPLGLMMLSGRPGPTLCFAARANQCACRNPTHVPGLAARRHERAVVTAPGMTDMQGSKVLGWIAHRLTTCYPDGRR